ncbi:MAG: TIGR04500 family putative peptide maturation system protein, partial [Thermomicrobiales bacterium]
MSDPLHEALAETFDYLVTLSRDGTRPDAARSGLRHLQERHPVTRMDLVWEEEAYDHSVHYDVLLHLPAAGTISLSYCPDRGLPWPLRGVHRWREKELLRVNASILQVDQAIACLDFMWDEAAIAHRLINVCLIQEELERQPIALSDDELQGAMDAFRRGRRLYTAEQTREWMTRRGLNHEQLEQMVADEATVAKLRERLTAGHVDAYFAEHRAEFDEARIAQCIFPDAEQAAAARQEIEAGAATLADVTERQFLAASPAVTEPASGLFRFLRRGAEPDALTSAVFDARPGELVGPVSTAEGHVVARVLAIRTAELDESTRRAIQQRLFDEWLEARRGAATIEWHWG